LQEKLAASGIQPAIKTESNMLAQTVVGFLPIALFPLVLISCSGSKSAWLVKALSLGKSKARVARDKNKITFAMSPASRKQDEVQSSSSSCATGKFQNSADAFQKAC
jgi:hypothetical protein